MKYLKEKYIEFCCDKMVNKLIYGSGERQFYLYSNRFHIGLDAIRFCPFCGAKIEIKGEQWQNTGS